MAGIQSLPVEIHQHILSLSPDPPSLRSLALSCSAFFKAFAVTEKATTTSVLSHHIHPQVQRDAIVALAASRLPARDPFALSTFVTVTLAWKDIISFPLEWSLVDALSAYKLYTHVSYFSQVLSRQLLGRPPFQIPDSKHDDSVAGIDTERSLPTPSTAELHRFERSLYLFEICSSLYRLSPLEDGRSWESWFTQLPKFQLEQLSCLNHLLTHFVAPAFNDLVQHDVSWGYFGVSLITDESSPLAQRVLSRGLETLHALAQTETYDERHRILHRGDNREDEPVGASGFLYDLLEWTPEATLVTNLLVSRLPSDKNSQALSTLELRSYQGWGYVFWDEARLEKLGALTHDGLVKLKAPADPLEAFRELENSQLQASRARRSEVWHQGGSGRWDQDDESKIVWPEKKKKSAQRKHPLMTARSVQGAKDFLRSLKIPDMPARKAESHSHGRWRVYPPRKG
ncbi:uncharacterized protein NECHADRAFT_85455 [Fusarium vanettenii 77-13-4]|uniref:F-box domain-containing protein n=1 Tax=Fusarium vanettenii (strain ATCC MYA-4622 / CBS 123669 / FGSC 9596 / NRRL 45880 / 77-13-4) TaxID=660122 RepID=C7ZNN8_FUSV7|nr:uncharacterized protein NECHADRAFT_85455 [Fusarium vanettenii 77-13-4]EEU34209.1 predicted protein [Fusarium vanettenii 77-13-4]